LIVLLHLRLQLLRRGGLAVAMRMRSLTSFCSRARKD
jgi:hypothetical protein